MSALKRLWHRLTGFSRIVGRDLEGNKFYEYPSVHGEWFKTKRVVKYARTMELWEYPGAQRRLPVQWTAWLTHTRTHPPTVEELQSDLERQARVQQNVARLRAHDAEVKAARLTAPFPNEDSHTPDYHKSPESSSLTKPPQSTQRSYVPPQAVETDQQPEEMATSPWDIADRPVESQIWKPAPARRRG